MKQELAVIIVGWNSESYIKDCLDSLTTQKFKNFDIFFVDNNSADGTINVVERYNIYRLIKNKENYGFAKGNNIAIKIAIKEGYQNIALINPDTVLDSKALELLIESVQETGVGAVQAKLLIYGTDEINSDGNEVHYLGFSYCGGYKNTSKSSEKRNIPAASGAAVIFKSEVLKKIGLLDERFFVYLEDTDLSWRIWESGYSVIIDPRAVIYHKYNFSRNKGKYYYTERNRLIFMIKNYELKTIILLFLPIFLTEILMIIYALLNGWIKLKIKGYSSIISNWNSIMKDREKIQKLKIIKDHDLKKLWITKLNFEEVTSPIFIPLNVFYNLYWRIFSWLI